MSNDRVEQYSTNLVRQYEKMRGANLGRPGEKRCEKPGEKRGEKRLEKPVKTW